MGRQLKYWEVNVLLAICLIAFGYVIFKRVKVTTYDMYANCKQMEASLNLASIDSAQINLLDAKLARMERFLKNKESEQSIQQLVLQTTTDFCAKNKLKLQEFEGSYSYNEQNYLVEVYSFEVTGKFTSCLKLINILEKNFDYARVTSTSFYTTENWNGQRKKLHCKIYLQSIKNNT